MSLLPSGQGCPTAWMAARMMLWDPGTWWYLGVSLQTRGPPCIGVSSAGQRGDLVFWGLTDDPNTIPTAPMGIGPTS